MTEKNNYLISAIVSTYNSENFIEGCLADLENQTIAENLEIIIINSGSQENEEKVIKKFQKKNKNIIYKKTQRETIYAAWNRGIKLAHGKYIINANTDDRHRNDSFEVLANELNNNKKIDLVYGDWYTTFQPNESYKQNSGDPNRILRYPEYFAPLCLLFFMFSPSPMWRKDIIDDIGYFDPDLKSAGDYDWNIRFALKKRAKHINEILGLFYDSQKSVSHSDVAYQEPLHIFNKYRTKENILKLYKMQGYSADTKRQRRDIFLDMANKAKGFIAPWDWQGLSCDQVFAQLCDSWAWEEYLK